MKFFATILFLVFSYNSFAQSFLPGISHFSNCNKVEHRFREWCVERNRKYLAIQSYHKSNPEGSKALLINANGAGQIPFLVFRLFPELFPEIWGGLDEPYDLIGLGVNPFAPELNLPLGIAMGPVQENLNSWPEGPQPINKVTFSCVACHAGEVKISDSKRLTIVGAPSTRINNLWFSFARTAMLEKFDSKVIREALETKPIGWFYSQDSALESRERDLLLRPGAIEEILGRFKTKSALQLRGFDFLANIYYADTKNVLDPILPRRGSLDGLIPSFLAVLRDYGSDPNVIAKVMPTTPAEVDSSSIWRQRNKGFKHWDGTQGVDLHRNIGAARANLNDPVDIHNVNSITNFINDLPSDPYPFDVDMNMARRGQAHFNKHCASCHGSVNKVFSTDSVGTDSTRALHFNPLMSKFQGNILAFLCNDPKLCLKENGQKYSADELSVDGKGYIAGSLDGIWARAPYLHNGSVPSLRALLTGKRPASFYRGNLNYDQRNVGFVSQHSNRTAVLYNTELLGQSNRGHSSQEYLGLDWNRNPKKLNELLEFLKTM